MEWLSSVLFLVLFVHIRGQCPEGFDNYLASEGRCYKLYGEKKTFSEAKSYCESLSVPSTYQRPGLVTIESATIQGHVRSIIKSADTNYDKTWIGLVETFTDWKWVPKTVNAYLESQGCYNNPTQVLQHTANPSATDVLDNSYCRNYCARNGYTYAGIYLQNGRARALCRCGYNFVWNNIDGITTGCKNMNCPGNALEYCGDEGKIMVYRVKDNTTHDELWASNEPNNYQNYAKCMVMKDWSERTLADSPCSSTTRTSHICQFPSAGCPYYYHSSTGTCYQMNQNSRKSWNNARMDCMNKLGDLLIIEEESLFSDVKSRPEMANEGDEKTSWWIGANAADWTWSNGVKMSKYSNWDDRNPNKAEGHCAVIHALSGGNDPDLQFKWEDQPCESTNTQEHFSSICQTEAVPSTTTSTTTTTTTTTTPTTPSTSSSAPTSTTTTTTTTTTEAATPSPSGNPTPPTQPTSPTSPTPPTPEPTGKPTDKTTPNPSSTNRPGNAGGSSDEGNDAVFTNGVIVAIVIAAVAVLVAMIRLLVYCCQRKGSPEKPGYQRGNDNDGFKVDNLTPDKDDNRPLEDIQVTNDTYASEIKSAGTSSSHREDFSY